jgi:hypothetical protein
MKRTVLAILVAVGVVGAATGTAEARRSGDDGRLGGPRVAVERDGTGFSHSICDCYDFAVSVGGPRLATITPDGSGPHLHFE